ncbi:hypothetical protein D3C75_615330 [compost metagenome]
MHVRNKAVLHVLTVLAVLVAAARKAALPAAIAHKVAIPVAAVRKAVILAATVHKVAIPVAAVRKAAILVVAAHKAATLVEAVHKAATQVAAVRKDKAVHHALTAVHKVNLAQAEVSHAVMTEVLKRTQLVADRIIIKDVSMMVKVVTTAVVVVRMVVARTNQWYTARRSITHLRKSSFVAA